MRLKTVVRFERPCLDKWTYEWNSLVRVGFDQTSMRMIEQMLSSFEVQRQLMAVCRRALCPLGMPAYAGGWFKAMPTLTDPNRSDECDEILYRPCDEF